MKEKKIFDAITNVRDELIEEARETKSRRKVSVWKKSVAVAASISLIIGLGLLIPRDKNKSTGAGAILDVIYPQAYAFEDYDTRRQVREQNPVEEGFIEAINGFRIKQAPIYWRCGQERQLLTSLTVFCTLPCGLWRRR